MKTNIKASSHSRKFALRTLIFLMAIMSYSTAFTHDFEVDGIYYLKNGLEATVTHRGSSYTSYSNEYTGDVIIPATVTYGSTTYTVTSIDNFAFSECSKVTSVTIPNTVISIGYYAFYYCSQLANITIPNSVVSIGQLAFGATKWLSNQPKGLVYAGMVAYKYKGTPENDTIITIREGTLGIATGLFSGNSKIIGVAIPGSVKCIGNGAFRGGSTLNSISVASNNPYYDSRNDCDAVIESNTNTLIAGCSNSSIPNSIIAIGDYALSECGIKLIDIPNSVTYIGKYSFYECDELESISIPNSVSEIGDYAFYLCDILDNVSLPNSVTTIGKYAFSGCSELTNITIPSSLNEISEGSFSNCKKLSSVDIPCSVTSIGSYAFGGCKVDELTLPNSINYLGANAFMNCLLFKVYCHITNPSSVQMASYVFSHETNNYTERILYVPTGLVATYQANKKWSDYFGSIVEMGYDNTLVASIDLNMNEIDINEGEKYQLIATVLPENATNKTLIWSSSNEAVATVNNSGLVTAVAPGNTNILVSTTDGSNLYVSCSVNVLTPMLDPIMAKMKPNTTLQINATGMNHITWTSSDVSVATVDENGIVTAIKPGLASITASSNGKNQWCAIFVYLPGDVNDDESVNISDVTSLIDTLLSGNN